MRGMSRTMNLPAIQKIMMDFERESSAMDMKEEMMSDAVDDVMEVRSRPCRSDFSNLGDRTRGKTRKRRATRSSKRSWTR
jgi:hypothetical protein